MEATLWKEKAMGQPVHERPPRDSVGHTPQITIIVVSQIGAQPQSIQYHWAHGPSDGHHFVLASSIMENSSHRHISRPCLILDEMLRP